MEQVINIALSLISLYLLAGVLFVVVFLWKGITKVDKGTEGTGLLFKLLIFPGLLIFWPHMLIKWIKTNR